MAYKRKYSKRRKPLKSTIKKALFSMSETKNISVVHDFRPLLVGISLAPQNAQINMLGSVDQGDSRTQRIGFDIHLKGFRCAVSYDNSLEQANVPAYITTLVVLTHDANPDISDDLYKAYNSTTLQATGADDTSLIAANWLEDVHTRAINTANYRVLHRSSIRLGCKLQPDMPGPRFAQRVFYVPVNKKITYPSSTIGTTTNLAIKPRIVMVHYVSNPTAVRQPPDAGTPGASCKIRSDIIGYYKDL